MGEREEASSSVRSHVGLQRGQYFPLVFSAADGRETSSFSGTIG
jgi:hypothetical protein